MQPHALSRVLVLPDQVPRCLEHLQGQIELEPPGPHAGRQDIPELTAPEQGNRPKGSLFNTCSAIPVPVDGR